MTRSDPKQGHLSADQAEELADLALAVLDENDQSDNVVDPIAILNAKKLLLVCGHYGQAYDGLLRHRDGQFTVFCNLDRVEDIRSQRARFTIAHELGHYFISNHRNALLNGEAPEHPSFCEYESKLFVEQQADCFASNLLLPRDRFTKVARSFGTSGGLRTILGLAQRFNTSVTATAIRYTSLSLSPCVVIKWNSDKYGWKWLSSHFYEAGYRRTIEEKTAIVTGSVTAQAFAGETLPKEGFFKKGTTASCWFPFVNRGSLKDVILHEHAKPLGRYGVLTVLYPDDEQLS